MDEICIPHDAVICKMCGEVVSYHVAPGMAGYWYHVNGRKTHNPEPIDNIEFLPLVTKGEKVYKNRPV